MPCASTCQDVVLLTIRIRLSKSPSRSCHLPIAAEARQFLPQFTFFKDGTSSDPSQTTCQQLIAPSQRLRLQRRPQSPASSVPGRQFRNSSRNHTAAATARHCRLRRVFRMAIGDGGGRYRHRQCCPFLRSGARAGHRRDIAIVRINNSGRVTGPSRAAPNWFRRQR